MSQFQFSPRTYRLIAIIFLVVIIGIAVAIVHFALPRATIEITAKADRSLAVSTFTITDQTTADDSENLSHINGTIVLTEATKKEVFTPQGQGKKVPERVRGTITLVNTSTLSQPLLSTTQLQLEEGGMIYRTQKYAIVPAKGELEIEVLADTEGVEGELKGGQKLVIIKLNSSRQKSVYGEVREPLGGGEKTIAIVTQADMDTSAIKLQATLRDRAKKTLEQKITTELTEDQISYSPVSTESKNKVGEETSEFEIAGELNATTVQFSQEDLLKLLKQQYTISLPAGYSLLGFNDHSIKWSLESVNEDATEATIRAEMEVFATLTPNSDVIDPQELVGLKVNDIKEVLLSNPNISAIKVTFWPFWRNTAPPFPHRITVVIENNEEDLE